MKMKIYFCYIILLLCIECVNAQTILLKAQVIYKNELLKNYTLLVDGRAATTDFSGILLSPVPNSKSQVKIQTQDKRYFILYPRGGNILVPKDYTLITEIMLGTFGDDPNIKVYNKILKELNDAGRKPGVNITPLQQKLDSIEALLTRLNYSKEDLRTARERQDGIDLYYPEITTTLRNYLSQANEVKNAFKYTAEFALSQQTALTVLIQAINSYNPVIEKLYLTQTSYSKKIIDYWQDTALQKKFDNITDNIINEITKKTVTKLNEIKNNINLFYQNKLAGNRQQNQEMIRREISSVLPVFTRQLEELEISIDNFNTLLAIY